MAYRSAIQTVGPWRTTVSSKHVAASRAASVAARRNTLQLLATSATSATPATGASTMDVVRPLKKKVKRQTESIILHFVRKHQAIASHSLQACTPFGGPRDFTATLSHSSLQPLLTPMSFVLCRTMYVLLARCGQVVAQSLTPTVPVSTGLLLRQRL